MFHGLISQNTWKSNLKELINLERQILGCSSAKSLNKKSNALNTIEDSKQKKKIFQAQKQIIM